MEERKKKQAVFCLVSTSSEVRNDAVAVDKKKGSRLESCAWKRGSKPPGMLVITAELYEALRGSITGVASIFLLFFPEKKGGGVIMVT